MSSAGAVVPLAAGDASLGGETIQMHRSSSMPVKPKPLESKPLARSLEKETVNEVDYYPESPGFRRRRHKSNQLETRSEQNFPYTNDWAGSTIELAPDVAGPSGAPVDSDGLRRSMHRVMEKNGRENVVFRRIPEKSWRYMRDVITTLVETDWKYMLTLFLGSYFASWIFFAILCYVVAYYHGDFLFDTINGDRLGEGKDPCIFGVRTFVAMLIYSIETQTTLGFGEKYASEECPETIFLFVMQMLCAVAIEGSMVSVIYAKTARPAKQMTKLKFSDKAVICYRDGKLCLLFRVCDPREQQTIESKIRVYMIVDKKTIEGEVIKTHTELKLEGNGEQLIVWPDLVCHYIDESSPLYHFKNAKQFNAGQFELYVSIVGTSPATAQMTEAKTSFVPREIFWGQRFVNIIHYDALQEHYMVDYENFNTTISVDMPMKITQQIELPKNIENPKLESKK
ncbi:ATP-sensitive inward rectifier potassium channel 12 [Drosophila willistoni]|uniref:ATP-sensitive inward rectifier potassium channel 12 n=1 Tax=Drosophila willistoni TaxID=7260 RepID=UPI00017D79AF|nr:ATP-sensitive inward rectifier potassium channel 12 [Drosophila willistoni]